MLTHFKSRYTTVPKPSKFCKVYVECNTTAQQSFVLKTGYDVQSGGVPTTAHELLTDTSSSSDSKPLNISSVLDLWAVLTQATLEVIAPPNLMSIFLPSVVNNSLSSLWLEYAGISLGRSANYHQKMVMGPDLTLLRALIGVCTWSTLGNLMCMVQ